MGDTPPYDDRDDHDGLAAIDHSYDYADGDSGQSDLEALAQYVPVAGYVEDEDEVAAAVGASLYVVQTDGDTDEEQPEKVFTVTNPPGTVTVTAYLDGRVKRIDLAPTVGGLTEEELADEIIVIAGLATMDARSAQYSFMLDGMREHGHSDVATRDFLTRDLELPSPEQADARRAQIFATRYEGSHE